MDEQSKTLWERVCATVNRLGSPRSPKPVILPLRAPEPRSIDLHGMTVSDAYQEVRAFLSDTPYGEVLVITGRSGVINAEFGYWLDGIARVQSYTEENGGGAYRIRIKRG